VTVKNGYGYLVVKSSGMVGAIGATVGLNVPGVTFSGSFNVLIVKATGAMNEDIIVAGETVTVTAAAGDSYVKVEGLAVTLTILGQRLQGDFAFEKITSVTNGVTRNVIRIAAANVSMGLGNGTTDYVVVEHGSGSLIVTSAGIAGQVSAEISIQNIPGVAFSGAFSLYINNTRQAVNETFTVGGETVAMALVAGPYLRVEGDDVVLTVLGQTLSGNFSFEQITTTGGAKVVRVAVSDVTLELTSGGEAIFSLSIPSGAMLITPQGIAAKLTVAPDDLHIGSALTLSCDTITFEINTLPVAVNETFTSGTTTEHMVLPAGKFVRIVAMNAGITISGYTLSGNFYFDQATNTATGVKITRMAMTGVNFSDAGLGGSISNGQGALIITATGVAGQISGRGSLGAAAEATVGLRINTTGGAVDQTIDVNGTTIIVRFSATETGFSFFASDIKITIADFVSIEGSVVFSGNAFAGEGIEIFVGQGPYRNDDGDVNEDAIGVLLTNAKIGLVRFDGGTYALHAEGTISFVGLDGIMVSGTGIIDVNNSGQAVNQTLNIPNTDRSVTVRFTTTAMVTSFIGSIELNIANILEIGGTVSFGKKPTGQVSVGLAGAYVRITVDGQEYFEIGGSASFTIGGVEGFKMESFKVNGFQIFGQVGIDTPATDAMVLFPTADLALTSFGKTTVELGKLGYLVYERSDIDGLSSDKRYIDVTFTDPNGVGLNENSILDFTPEFTLSMNGQTLTGVTVNGRPVKVTGGLPNTYRYTLTGNFNQIGDVTVNFIAGSWYDNNGVSNFAETEFFCLVNKKADGTLAAPAPSATLSSPSAGETLAILSMNNKRYIDVTFVTRSDSAIDATSINGDEFTLSGPGVGDIKMMAGTAGTPDIVGSPVLISGTTYRYYLKDANTTNTIDLFKAGEVVVTFRANSFKTVDGTFNNAASVTFTLDATVVGQASSTKSLKLGPLVLQGPYVGIEDIGFKDGFLMLTIGIGVDRATLAFGGSSGTTTSTQQQSSGITADLTGVLGTFDFGVDVFGLLSGNVRVTVPGNFSFRVAGLEVEVPGVVLIEAEGIKIAFEPAPDAPVAPVDPGAGATDEAKAAYQKALTAYQKALAAYPALYQTYMNQELVRVESAKVTFPSFGLSGMIKPFDPNTAVTGDEIPGLVIRQIGRAHV
jgi:hypothetical protein